MRLKLALAICALCAGLGTSPAHAQNVVRHGPWEGFATRTPDGRFEHCVLYNRTIQALTASPANMLGLTRDGAGRVGLIAFFEPRSLTRTDNASISVRIDQRPPVTVSGVIPSDFHAISADGLDPETLTALSAAKTIEVTVASRTLRVELSDAAGVLGALQSCASANAP